MNRNTYRRQIIRRLHILGVAFLALTMIILAAGICFGTDSTAAILTALIGVTLTLSRDSWLDF